MKIRNNLVLRKIGSRYMIVEVSKEAMNLTNVYTMNETAAMLWKSIGAEDFTEPQLVEFLCDTYEVTEEQAAADVHSLIEEWRKLGLLL